METWSIVTVLVCTQLIVGMNSRTLPTKEQPLHEHPTLVAMVEQNNAYRNQNGLAKHRVSLKLTEMAQAHANWMASNERFEHDYDHSYPEVIYCNAADVPSAFSGWVNSGPHRSIILSGTTHVGYGYAVSASGQTYWCGIFGNM